VQCVSTKIWESDKSRSSPGDIISLVIKSEIPNFQTVANHATVYIIKNVDNIIHPLVPKNVKRRKSFTEKLI
jgi:hypothetical protein